MTTVANHSKCNNRYPLVKIQNIGQFMLNSDAFNHAFGL